MQSSSRETTLANIVDAIKSKRMAEARSLLKDFLHSNPNDAQGWYLANFLVDNLDQRLKHLQRALQYDPNHAAAQQLHRKLQEQMLGNLFDGPAATEKTQPVSTVNQVTPPRRLRTIGAALLVLLCAALMFCGLLLPWMQFNRAAGGREFSGLQLALTAIGKILRPTANYDFSEKVNLTITLYAPLFTLAATIGLTVLSIITLLARGILNRLCWVLALIGLIGTMFVYATFLRTDVALDGVMGSGYYVSLYAQLAAIAVAFSGLFRLVPVVRANNGVPSRGYYRVGKTSLQLVHTALVVIIVLLVFAIGGSLQRQLPSTNGSRTGGNSGATVNTAANGTVRCQGGTLPTAAKNALDDFLFQQQYRDSYTIVSTACVPALKTFATGGRVPDEAWCVVISPGANLGGWYTPGSYDHYVIRRTELLWNVNASRLRDENERSRWLSAGCSNWDSAVSAASNNQNPTMQAIRSTIVGHYTSTVNSHKVDFNADGSVAWSLFGNTDYGKYVIVDNVVTVTGFRDDRTGRYRVNVQPGSVLLGNMDGGPYVLVSPRSGASVTLTPSKQITMSRRVTTTPIPTLRSTNTPGTDVSSTQAAVVAVAPTPTPIPATPVPPANLSQPFVDDFSDNRHGWNLATNPNVARASIANGRFLVTLKENHRIQFPIPTVSATNFYAEFHAIFLDRIPPGTVGFAIGNDNTYHVAYAFINSGPRLREVVNGKTASDSSGSGKGFRGAKELTFGLQAVNGVYTAYINGQVSQTWRFTPQGTTISLFIEHGCCGDGPIAFTNVTVRPQQ